VDRRDCQVNPGKKINEKEFEFYIMGIESIIGIVSGSIAIAVASYGVYKWIKGILRPNLQKLFNQLVEEVKKGNRIEQTKLLRTVSKALSKQCGCSLFSDDFINNFHLSKGKCKIFDDICYENKIYPKTEICMALLGYDSPAARKNYEERVAIENKKKKSQFSPTTTITSPSFIPQENTVFLSELLYTKFTETCEQLMSILAKHGIPYKFLKSTKDIWCRDYMPVQTPSGKFVQFRYEPSYLKGYEHLRTDPQKVCSDNELKLDIRHSKINLDGGNILRYSNKIIVSDRVYSENPKYTDKEELIEEIKNLLEVKEVIVIPAQKSDLAGHADGMVRFVNEKTILGNDRKYEYANWVRVMNKVLHKYGLTYMDIPFFEHKDNAHPDNAIGIYVNYLEVKDLIVLPIFGIPCNKDDEAVRCFKKIFHDRKIETINYTNVGLEGGLLNCTTWVV
jgi:agmatine deiminase